MAECGGVAWWSVVVLRGVMAYGGGVRVVCDKMRYCVVVYGV